MATSSRTKSDQAQVYLTANGLAEAKSELEFLKTKKRTEVAERIQQAREFGDTLENAEYDAALEQQALVENRIIYLEEVLKNAKVISEKKESNFVIIGSTVAIETEESVDEFTIVGKMEAAPAKKMISNESPLGTALLGAKVGDIVEVKAPIVNYKCKVLKIR